MTFNDREKLIAASYAIATIRPIVSYKEDGNRFFKLENQSDNKNCQNVVKMLSITVFGDDNNSDNLEEFKRYCNEVSEMLDLLPKAFSEVDL